MAKNYTVTAVLYQGDDGCVTVSSAVLTKQKIPAAVKTQRHTSLEDANLTIREAMNQMSLKHPNICQVIDFYIAETGRGRFESVLILELMDCDLNAEIAKRAETNSQWTEEEILRIAKGLLSALTFAKRVGICHRDLKPQNIYISGDVVKLGDFGSSKYIQNIAENSLQGSPFYLSPELKVQFISMLQTGISKVEFDPYKSDVYSLGITLLYMMKLRQPSELVALVNLAERTKQLISECSEYPKLQELLSGMLEVSPLSRLSLEQCEEAVDRLLAPPAPKEYCIMCRSVISDRSWSTGISPSRVYVKVTCSLRCLAAIEEIIGHSDAVECANCMVLFPSDEVEAVKLPCGHCFHSLQCFYQFVSENLKPVSTGSYKCQHCRQPIPHSTLKRYFGPCNQAPLERLRDAEMCSVCETFPGVFALSCDHCCCIMCAESRIARCKVCKRETKCIAG